jgi:hypothetical protein
LVRATIHDHFVAVLVCEGVQDEAYRFAHFFARGKNKIPGGQYYKIACLLEFSVHNRPPKGKFLFDPKQL